MSNQNLNNENQSEDKIWEKPWTYNDLQNYSTTWSLAGDSGLLLHLKQFSENLMSKSINVEKQLQKLIYEEKQCQVKLDNVTSSFLILENTQFIENRVYEHVLSETKAQDNSNVKIEKTKEEKEQDLFNKINEAVGIGMSIMDNYFDKIDPKQLKKDEEMDDDDDDYREDETTENNPDDLFIYETKDPYVLRSLPYLIGSQAYLESDHVGLKDLDSDDEESEEEEEAEPDDDDESTEKMESSSEYSDDDDEDENDKRKASDKRNEDKQSITTEDSQSTSNKNKTKEKDSSQKAKKPKIYDDSDDDDDDEGGLFKPDRNKKSGLFDNSDESEKSDDDIDDIIRSRSESKKSNQINNTKKNEEDEEESIGEPEEKSAAPSSKPLDFAAELSLRLAAKQNKPEKVIKESNESEDDFETDKQPLAEKPAKTERKQSVKIVQKSSSLFEAESEEENDIFSNKITSGRKNSKPAKSLFDDSDDDDDNESSLFKNEKPIEPEKSSTAKRVAEKSSNSTAAAVADKQIDIKSALNDLFAKKPQPAASILNEEDEDDEDDSLFKTSSKPEKKTDSKTSVVDFDKEKRSSSFLYNESAKPQNENVKRPSIQPTKKASLFDDDDDEEEDSLFSSSLSKNTKPAAEVVVPAKTSTKLETVKETTQKVETVKSKPSLFDDDENDDDLFKTISSSKNTSNKNQTQQAKLPEKSDTKPKKSLFDSDSPEEKEPVQDLFASIKQSNNNQSNKENDSNKKQIPIAKPAGSLFDTDSEKEEDLFSKKPPAQAPLVSKPIEVTKKPIQDTNKASLFDDDPLGVANLEISTKSKTETVSNTTSTSQNKVSDGNRKPSQPAVQKSLFDEDDDDDDDDDKLVVKTDKKPVPDLLSDLKNDSVKDSNKTSAVKKNDDKQIPKPAKSLFSSSSDDENADLFKISKPASKPETKANQLDPAITKETKDETKPIIPKPVKTEKVSLFDDDEEDDLFQVKDKKITEPPVEKKSEKEKEKEPNEDDLEIKEEESAPAQKFQAKNFGKSLFDPKSLKGNSLFQKIAEKSNVKDDSDNEEDKFSVSSTLAKEKAESSQTKTPSSEPISFKSIETPKPKKDEVKPFEASVLSQDSGKTKKLIQDPLLFSSDSLATTNDDDIFGEIKVDAAFKQQEFKNAQKDRIKASGKKRAPISRKPAETGLNTSVFDDLIEKQEEPKKIEQSKVLEEPKVPEFDPLGIINIPEKVIEKSKPEEPKVEQKVQTKEASLFDDDIFSIKENPTKSKVEIKSDVEEKKVEIQQEIKTDAEKSNQNDEKIVEIKEKPTNLKSSIFDNVLDDTFKDDLDLFKPSSKKKSENKTKKGLESMFDDDTDIFSDTSLLSATKKDTKPKEQSTKTNQPAAASASSSKSKKSRGDIFGDLDDDDIFNIGTTSSSTKPKEEKTKSTKKAELFDDPLNNIF